MILPTPAAKAHRSRSIAPQSDRLEPRLLLAKAPAQVAFLETPDGSGTGTYSIQVTGTSRNNVIFITDDGKHAAGSVQITADGAKVFTNTQPFSEISVATGAGKDRVFYNLTGDVAPGPAETILVGSTTPRSGTLKGGGNVQVTANLNGSIQAGATLLVFALADRKGSTALTVNHAGVDDGSLGVGVGVNSAMSAKPRSGAITLNYNSTAALSSLATSTILMIGGSTRNVMNVNFAGTNDGNIELLASGNGAKDVLSADIQMKAGSMGTVGKNMPARVSATGSTPKVRFTIARGGDSSPSSWINAQITATSRRSVTVHTANVSASSAGRDTTVG